MELNNVQLSSISFITDTWWRKVNDYALWRKLLFWDGTIISGMVQNLFALCFIFFVLSIVLYSHSNKRLCSLLLAGLDWIFNCVNVKWTGKCPCLLSSLTSKIPRIHVMNQEIILKPFKCRIRLIPAHHFFLHKIPEWQPFGFIKKEIVL